MYSWEINDLMMKRKNRITPKEYFQICDTSPQITHIHYDAGSRKYTIYADENNVWEFMIQLD